RRGTEVEYHGGIGQSAVQLRRRGGLAQEDPDVSARKHRQINGDRVVARVGIVGVAARVNLNDIRACRSSCYAAGGQRPQRAGDGRAGPALQGSQFGKAAVEYLERIATDALCRGAGNKVAVVPAAASQGSVGRIVGAVVGDGKAEGHIAARHDGGGAEGIQGQAEVSVARRRADFGDKG